MNKASKRYNNLLARRFLAFLSCFCVLGTLFYLTTFAFLGGFFYFSSKGVNVITAMLSSGFLAVGSFATLMSVLDKRIDIREKELAEEE
jgi:hypothetical protein